MPVLGVAVQLSDLCPQKLQVSLVSLCFQPQPSMPDMDLASWRAFDLSSVRGIQSSKVGCRQIAKLDKIQETSDDQVIPMSATGLGPTLRNLNPEYAHLVLLPSKDRPGAQDLEVQRYRG